MTETAIKKEDITEDNLNLDVLIENKLPIFILNRSEPRGDVTIQYFRANGDPDLILIPKTWIPIDISKQASHKTLMDCDDLRRNIRNGMLELIPPSKGEKIMEDTDAIEEYERITISKFAAYGKKSGKDDSSSTFVKELSDTTKINIRIQDIMSRSISDQEKYQLLRSEEDLLTKEDIRFILSKVESDGKLKKWASDLYETKLKKKNK